MFLREYETTIILRSDLPPSVLDSAIERVRDTVNNNGGKMLEINHWGKKKLAYDIQKQSRGVYFYTNFLGEGPTVKELERTMKLSDNILRFLTVQLSAKVDPETRKVKEYVKPQYDAEESKEEEAGKPGAKTAAKEPKAEAKAEPKAEEKAEEKVVEKVVEEAEEKAEAKAEEPAIEEAEEKAEAKAEEPAKEEPKAEATAEAKEEKADEKAASEE